MSISKTDFLDFFSSPQDTCRTRFLSSSTNAAYPLLAIVFLQAYPYFNHSYIEMVAYYSIVFSI